MAILHKGMHIRRTAGAHRAGAARRTRKTAAAATAAGVVLTVLSAASYAQAANAPAVSAKGAFLLDSATGAKVYGKGADTRRPMASTTKIMTVRVVLGQAGLDLDRKVTVQQDYRDYVASKGASTADLRTGDKVTVRQLMYATLLPSGCDAAYALADTFGTGSTRSARVKSFIGKMNKKGADLGLSNTHFDSFDGNSTTGENYTTPRDLATLARSAMQYSAFRTVVKTQKTVQRATASNGGTRTYTWYNTNKLLGSYTGATGIKTGTNTPAGPCLVFSATRGGKTLIGVVLNGSDRYQDAAKLLDYGFGTNDAPTMKTRSLPAGAQQD